MQAHNTTPVHPTLADVARMARVSTATVSRCLRHPDLVLPATRDRVLEVIRQLNYTPNFGGVALASKKTNTIGVVIPTMNNAIFAHGVQAFEETMSASGLNVLVASSNYDPEREYQHVRSLIARGADGLLLIGTDKKADTYRLIQQRGIPYVLAWCYQQGTQHYFTGFNNVEAAAAMARHVLSFGHSKLAMISGMSRTNDRARDRIRGVQLALEQAKMDTAAMPVIETRYSIRHGGEALSAILNQHSQTTALICGNDVLAVGAIIEARRRGIRVPQELSIVGFDNIELALAIRPQLTTVQVPHDQMGHKAAQLLLALGRGEEVQSIELETAIVHRDSLAEARAADADVANR